MHYKNTEPNILSGRVLMCSRGRELCVMTAETYKAHRKNQIYRKGKQIFQQRRPKDLLIRGEIIQVQ
jgi:hypothetical protein